MIKSIIKTCLVLTSLSSFSSFADYYAKIPLEVSNGGHLPNDSITIIDNNTSNPETPTNPTIPEEPVLPEGTECRYTGTDYWLVIDFRFGSSYYYAYKDRVVWDNVIVIQPYRNNLPIASYNSGGYQYYAKGDPLLTNDYGSSGIWYYYQICRQPLDT